ncbi:hypothetical protein MOR12E_03345 [Methylobacterium oryzae]
MEHYRSTLGTTAVAVFGLVAAAHILHPGNYEVQTRPARPAVTDAAPVSKPAAAPVTRSAWVDPPAKLAAPETTGALAAAPLRHAALVRTAESDRLTVTAAAPQPAPAAAPSQKIDPIGDIIRGLGFGRDG